LHLRKEKCTVYNSFSKTIIVSYSANTRKIEKICKCETCFESQVGEKQTSEGP
jgi:hypothetical protein